MLKVLIAEDDLMIADMAEEILLNSGYEVCGIGRTVAEAIALGKQHEPDLAMIDLRLADGGLGTDVAAELLATGKLGILYATGNISTVMLTGANGHACLAKPYHPADLLRALEIVAELVATGTASPPLPRRFQVLPSARTVAQRSPGVDDDPSRVAALLRQLAAIAQFGSYALHQPDLHTLLTEAARVCAESFGVPFCQVSRYRPENDDLLLEAGFGWQSGLVGQLAIRADTASPQGRAFITGKSSICNDLREAGNFRLPPFYAAHGIVSLLNVIIEGDDQPFGVIEIDSDQPQHYDRHDIDLLTTFANIVAQGVASSAGGIVMRQTTERLRTLIEENDRLLEHKQDMAAELQHRVRNNMQLVYGMLNTQASDTVDAAGRDRVEAIADRVSAMAPVHDQVLNNNNLKRAANRPILIVEDNAVLRKELADRISNQPGFVAFPAGTLDEADKAISGTAPCFDAILLDVGLPDGDGRDFCSKLRQQGHAMPIIMLTGANAADDIVRGLEAGANDYIAKPFGWDELLARLRVQLRGFEDSESAIFSIGPYTFQPSKKELRDLARNRRIRLTHMEAAVLKFLYRSGPHVVGRGTLLTAVWGYNSRATTHTLETHVYRLRQKIEANAATPTLLLSEPGGYRLNL